MGSRASAVIALLTATFFWGSTFPIMKVIVTSLDPVLFTSLRFIIATATLFLIFRGRIKRDRAHISAGLILALTLVLGHVTQIIGLKYTTPTKSAFITAMYVVFVPLASYLLVSEKVSSHQILSLAMAVLGLYLMTSPESTRMNFGDVLTLLCAVAFAFQIALVHRYSKILDPVSLTLWETLFTFTLTFPIGLMIGSHTLYNLGALSLLFVFYIGVFPTALSFFIQMTYQRALSAVSASLIYATEPIFGHALSYVFLGDKMPLIGYLGAILIVLAMIIGNKS